MTKLKSSNGYFCLSFQWNYEIEEFVYLIILLKHQEMRIELLCSKKKRKKKEEALGIMFLLSTYRYVK
jgi:hypothetical protein